MSFNLLDFNGDGNISFGEELAMGMLAGGAGYLAGQDSSKAEAFNTIDQLEQKLGEQLTYNRQLEEDLGVYKALYFKARAASQPDERLYQDTKMAWETTSQSKSKKLDAISGRSRWMSAYKCELCGGTKFSKNGDDEFVCRECGVIFSAAQLKAMASLSPKVDYADESILETNGEAGWFIQLEELAQTQLDARDFNAVRDTYKEFENECVRKDIEFPGRISPLLFCLNSLAESATNLLYEDRSSVLAFGAAIRQYLKHFAIFETPHNWFSSIVSPTISFVDLNVEIAKVLLDRVMALQDTADLDRQFEFNALRRNVATLLLNQPASALSALETIYVMVSRGCILPSDANAMISTFEESLSNALNEVDYVKKMSSELSAACWKKDGVPVKLKCTIQSQDKDIIAEASSLLKQNNFILAKADFELLSFSSSRDSADRATNPLASFVGNLSWLYDDVLKTFDPFSLDFAVHMHIERFGGDLEATELAAPSERFPLIETMRNAYFDVVSEVVVFLTRILRDLRDEDPFRYEAYQRTENQLSIINEAILKKSTDLLIKMVQADNLSFTEALTTTQRILASHKMRLCFNEEKYGEINSSILASFKSAISSTQSYTDKFNSKSKELENHIEKIRNEISQAEADIQNLGLLKITEKGRITKVIKQLEVEKNSIENQLTSLADSLRDEMWHEITKNNTLE